MDFLKKITSVEKPKEQNDICILHNRKVIDKVIYKLIGLSEHDIDIIEQNLRLNEIYLPPKNL